MESIMATQQQAIEATNALTAKVSEVLAFIQNQQANPVPDVVVDGITSAVSNLSAAMAPRP
jgi:hypothetical protein